jgi:hypothetical protein
MLELDCTVRRIEPGVGIAVTFDASRDGGKERLEALLASLPQA